MSAAVVHGPGALCGAVAAFRSFSPFAAGWQVLISHRAALRRGADDGGGMRAGG